MEFGNFVGIRKKAKIGNKTRREEKEKKAGEIKKDEINFHGRYNDIIIP